MITVLFKMYKRSCKCCLNVQITRQDFRCHSFGQPLVFASYPIKVCSMFNPEYVRPDEYKVFLRGRDWEHDDVILAIDKAAIEAIMTSLLWKEPETKERCLL